MLNYKEANKKYTKAYNDYQKAIAATKAIEDKQSKLFDKFRAAYKEDNEEAINNLNPERENNKQELAKAKRNELKKRLVCDFCKDNKHIAFYNDNIKIAIDIWNKYTGKKYGEKTSQKIHDEMKKHNIIFYIGSHDWTLTQVIDGFVTPACIEVNGDLFSDDKRVYAIDSYNVIQKIDIDTVRLYTYNEYVENVNKRATECLKAFDKVQEIHKTFDIACGEFNHLKPTNVNNLYDTNFKTYMY